MILPLALMSPAILSSFLAHESPIVRSQDPEEAPVSAPVSRFAVIGFKPDNQNTSATLTDALAAAISKKRGFELVERGELSRLMGEVVLSEQGLIEDSGLEMGNFAAVQYLIYGSISNVSSSTTRVRDGISRTTIVDVVIRVTDPKRRGTVAMVESLRGTSYASTEDEGVQNAINSIALSFADKIGSLVSISDGDVIDVEDSKDFRQVTIGLGKKDLVQVGDIFAIGTFRMRKLRLGGREVDRPEFRRICHARITSVHDEYCNAELGEPGKDTFNRPVFRVNHSLLKDLKKRLEVDNEALLAQLVERKS